MRLTLALLLSALLVPAALAQPEGARPLPFPTEPPLPALSEAAEVSMLTMLPGREVYSLYGHTALRVRDPLLGMDRTYNYGTFDFNQPNFVIRFLRGQLDYQLAAAPFERTLAEYHFLGRPILEQKLALDAAERQEVFRYLEANLLPEHRTYRYDFLFDNCSTRPRDVLEWALGERMVLGGYAPPEGTFRDLVGTYQRADPGLDLAIGLGLGGPMDRPPTPREAQFLPLELFRALEAATVDGRPLVAATDTLFWVPGAGLPPRAFPWPVALGWALFIGGAALTLWPAAAAARARGVLDAVLLGVAGAAGLLLALLWFGTEHVVTKANADLLWAWPTHLAAAFFVARDNLAPAFRVYLLAAAALALAAALSAGAGLLALHAGVLPLALLIALRCGARALPLRRPAPSPA